MPIFSLKFVHIYESLLNSIFSPERILQYCPEKRLRKLAGRENSVFEFARFVILIFNEVALSPQGGPAQFVKKELARRLMQETLIN